MRSHSPILAGRFAAKTADGLDRVVEQLLQVVRPTLSHKTIGGHTVSVDPRVARLHTGLWSVRTPVRVLNRTSVNLFSIWLKITPDRVAVDSRSIEVEGGPPTTALRGNVGPISVAADVIRIDCLDANDREAVFLIIHTLPGYSSREFIVQGTTSLATQAEFEIASFKREPDPLLEKPDETAIPLAPPESIRIKSTSLNLRPR